MIEVMFTNMEKLQFETEEQAEKYAQDNDTCIMMISQHVS